MLLSVIVPVYNEEPHLERFIDYLMSAPCALEREIIFINDCSSDGSLFILKEAQKKYKYQFLDLQKHQGKGAAVVAGIGVARGDFIMIQDADFEYDVTEVDDLLLPLIHGECDVVYGSRFKKTPAPLTYQYFANKALTYLSNLFSGTNLTDMETCYKIFRAHVLKKMDLKSRRFGIEVEITALLAQGGHTIKELPISFRPRTKKEGKKIGWRDGVAALYHLAYFNLQPSRSLSCLVKKESSSR